MTLTYCIADRIIEIKSLYPYIHTYCREYIATGQAPDITVDISDSDISFERDRSPREHVGIWKDEYLETLAVYRKIAEKMPEFDTFLFHGSCVAVDGRGYLFTAASGTGKSTHARLWKKMLGSRAVYINDDKPLLRLKGGRAIAYGTPWDGKHHLSTNTSAPLKAVCILERSEKNRIEKITAEEAYPMLLQQTYRPADPAALIKTLELLDRLGRCVSFYRLGCSMEPEAAEVAFAAMSGGRHK